ncbi:MAG: Glutamate-semialdehyde -aminomutase [Candidatus Parcubacteria bacterium]
MRIPGGNQLLSKRAEMLLPGYWPSYYAHASGIRVTDLDGNAWIDFASMGVGACILGYADPEVNAAVHAAVDQGVATSLNCPEEVTLAETLCRLHPWAHMARFARTGGEAMAMAVRIARAASGKDRVAFCGYHGWSDWYLASNIADANNLDAHLLAGLEPSGVPRALQGTALPFAYNDIDALECLVASHADIGAIVMEPMRHQAPTNGFLERVRAVADRIGAVLVVDEMTSGWRTAIGGMHPSLGLTPDIAVFGKAMGNGFAISAVIGKREVMEAAQGTFMSSTSWSERIGPVAALATIAKMETQPVVAHLEQIGARIIAGWERAAAAHGLRIQAEGPAAMPTFRFLDSAQGLALSTLFTQEMLARGYLATSGVYVSFAHTTQDVDAYLDAVDAVFAILADAEKKQNAAARLAGSVKHAGFKRLTS